MLTLAVVVAVLSVHAQACVNADVKIGTACCPGSGTVLCSQRPFGFVGYCKAVAGRTSRVCVACNQKGGMCCPGSVFGVKCYATNGFCFSMNTDARGTDLTCKECNSPSPVPTPCCPTTQVGELCHQNLGKPGGYPSCGGGACGICSPPAKGPISRTNPPICRPCGKVGQPKCPSCQPKYAQCGGTGWNGATCCLAGLKCTPQNAFYSQCE